jgi:hypothetical protein
MGTGRYGSKLPKKGGMGLGADLPRFLQADRTPVLKRVKQRSGRKDVGETRER